MSPKDRVPPMIGREDACLQRTADWEGGCRAEQLQRTGFLLRQGSRKTWLQWTGFLVYAVLVRKLDRIPSFQWPEAPDVSDDDVDIPTAGLQEGLAHILP